MTLPLVKICGIQSVSMIESIAHLPMDYIGFVFAKSRRQVSADQAADMIASLKEKSPAQPKTVGVFVNPEIEELEKLLQTAALDVIQLHGQETPEFCKQVKDRLGKKVFKVFSVPPDGSEGFEAGLTKQLGAYTSHVDAIMLDTFEPMVGGGSGKTFPWDKIPFVQAWAKTHQVQLLIAGGLNPNNVERLINNYAPDGVDVSSGVETDGLKDPIKIKTFIERVKYS
jgi:phosphoribosylanthranilate isomerase